MKKNFLLICAVAAALLSGCTGAYKSTQTPDDVYYSPARGGVGAAADTYDDYTASTDDNYLRMKVKDHYRWSDLDDYAYWNDSRYFSNNYYYSDFYNNNWVNNYYGAWGGGYGAFGYGNAYNFNPYGGWYGYYGSHWNSWYNPYYTVVYYKNPQTYKALSSGSNLSAFSNRNYNNSNQLYRSNTPNNTKGGSGNYNNSNFGSLVRKVFSSGDGNSYQAPSNPNYGGNAPSRTYAPSAPAPSSSAGGRSGGYNSSGSSGGSRPARN